MIQPGRPGGSGTFRRKAEDARMGVLRAGCCAWESVIAVNADGIATCVPCGGLPHGAGIVIHEPTHTPIASVDDALGNLDSSRDGWTGGCNRCTSTLPR